MQLKKKSPSQTRKQNSIQKRNYAVYSFEIYHSKKLIIAPGNNAIVVKAYYGSEMNFSISVNRF